ncbi:MAG TPA: phenylalanine--tRNA ligase subunit beta, partial [Thermoplasmata archaeon]
TAITEDTKDIFVDCTGTDINAVQASVNILTTALAERGGKIKTVRIRRESEDLLAPDLEPRKMTIDVGYVNSWNGTSLNPQRTVDCLKRMGLGAAAGDSSIEVLVPAYRADILHPVDLAEDAAIGYGFERFGTELPRRATFGEEIELNRFSNSVRYVMMGLGYMEVVTLSLTNPREQFEAMNLDAKSPAVRVVNPVSQEHTLIRTSLLPSLLGILRKNKHRDLPQRIFETGEVVKGIHNRKLLSAMCIHAKASFTEEKSLVQGALAAMGAGFEVAGGNHPSFIRGRCALVMHESEEIGVFGELSPSTLEAFELKYPTIAFELDLQKLFEITSRQA